MGGGRATTRRSLGAQAPGMQGVGGGQHHTLRAAPDQNTPAVSAQPIPHWPWLLARSRALHRVSAGLARRARGARHNGGWVNPQGRKGRARRGVDTKRSFSAATGRTLPNSPLCLVAQQLTPQTLPGWGRLDAGHGLPYVALRGTRLALTAWTLAAITIVFIAACARSMRASGLFGIQAPPSPAIGRCNLAGCVALCTSFNLARLTSVYICVVSSLAWPKRD